MNFEASEKEKKVMIKEWRDECRVTRVVAKFLFLCSLAAALPVFAEEESVFPPPPAQEQQQPGQAPGPAPVEPPFEAKPDKTPSEVTPEPGLVKPKAEPGKAQAPVRVPPELMKINLRMDNLPLPIFFKAINQQTQVNFILAEGIEDKKMSVYLEGVTVEEALNVLLGAKGLAYEKIPGKKLTYLVTTRKETAPRMITRIFELQYIPLLDIQITELKGEDQSSGGAQAGGAPPGAEMGGGAQGGKSGSESIVAILRTLLSSFGKIAVDERTNSLVITDLPERFAQIESLIRDLDKKMPQVSIESQIVEVNSDGLSKMGIEFGGSNGELFRYIGPSRYSDYAIRADSPFTGSLFSPVGPPGTYEKATYNAPGASPVTVFDTRSGVTLGVLSFNEFQAVLRAIVTKTRGKLLARPKITTINNKPAEIRVTRNQAIGVSTLQGGLGTSGTSVERQLSGLILRVTPQINGDGYITMIVEPKLTRVVDSSIGLTVKDPVTRALKSMIRVRNGETVVLGGLMDTREERTVRKVPLLGDIPVLGWILFRSWSTQKINSELAIFLTPTILEN